jgi:hypothetical protein
MEDTCDDRDDIQNDDQEDDRDRIPDSKGGEFENSIEALYS